VSTVFGNQCPQCGADIIAAEWSEHLSESCVRNVWSCEACGYQFEDRRRMRHRGPEWTVSLRQLSLPH
jgi:hypothetical protein